MLLLSAPCRRAADCRWRLRHRLRRSAARSAAIRRVFTSLRGVRVVDAFADGAVLHGDRRRRRPPRPAAAVTQPLDESAGGEDRKSEIERTHCARACHVDRFGALNAQRPSCSANHAPRSCLGNKPEPTTTRSKRMGAAVKPPAAGQHLRRAGDALLRARRDRVGAGVVGAARFHFDDDENARFSTPRDRLRRTACAGDGRECDSLCRSGTASPTIRPRGRAARPLARLTSRSFSSSARA